jgi:hypothetical protein
VIFFFIDPNLTWRNEFFKESLQIFPKSLWFWLNLNQGWNVSENSLFEVKKNKKENYWFGSFWVSPLHFHFGPVSGHGKRAKKSGLRAGPLNH